MAKSLTIFFGPIAVGIISKNDTISNFGAILRNCSLISSKVAELVSSSAIYFFDE
jgi:putative effector of murein hydrolase LrgA (UPF0299 family)